MLLPSPSFLLLVTSTPKGFNGFSLPACGPLSMVEMLKGADGGEGGRPVQKKEFSQIKIIKAVKV